MATVKESATGIGEIGAMSLLESHSDAKGLSRKHGDSREVSYVEDTGCIAACKRFMEHIYLKRLRLFVLILVVAYTDVAVDAYNSYELFEDGQFRYAVAMAALLFVPNFLTWNFLWANGMTDLKHLPVILLQLGPLNGFLSSWETGEVAGDLFWYTASEGLMEATFTGVLTAYLTTFGGDIPSTFYVGVVSSYLSISKTAVALNFYLHPNTGLLERACEFFNRFLEVSLRLSSLACFAYLMKDQVAVDREIDRFTNTQTAILAWLLLSLSSNMTMISMAEPNCPLSVNCFFGVILMFISPPEFLRFFTTMRQPFEFFRYLETSIMVCLAITPLQVNPRLWDLYEQAPFMVWTFVCSFAVMTAKTIIRSLLIFGHYVCHTQHDYMHPGDDDGSSKLERAQITQATFYKVIASGDLLMTNLFLNLEGASLKDDSVVTLLAHKYLPEACKQLEKKGMRSLDDVAHHAFADDSKLKLACEPKKDTWTLQDYLDCGLPAKYLKGGFTAKELGKIFPLQELKDAGFEVADLYQTGCTPLELKNVVFGDGKDMDLQDVRSLRDIGLTWKELKEAGCSAGMLLELGCSGEQMLTSCSPPANEEESLARWQKEVAFAVESARRKQLEKYERLPAEEQQLILSVFTMDRSLLLTRLQFTDDADKAVTKQEKDALLDSVVKKRDELIKSLRQVSPKDFGDEHRRMTNMVYLLQGLALSAKDASRWALDLKIYAIPDGGYKAVCRDREMRLGSWFPLSGNQSMTQSRQFIESRATILEAWTSGKISHISGPAGTGKTTTMKQVCAELGLKPHIAHCSDTMGRKEIEEFSTLTDGEVLVLDEFNRLSTQAMDIFLELFPRMANYVAIVINAGYAGRSQLPDALKEQCVTLTTKVVLQEVLEGKLFAAGFISAEDLAEKMSAVDADCQNNIVKQSFYNFGMRLNDIVIDKAAATLKRKDTVEEEVIIIQEALLMFGFMMIDNDRKILVSAIERNFNQPVDASVFDLKNVDLLSETLKTKHAVILTGLEPGDYTRAIRGLQSKAMDAGAKVICVPQSGSILDYSAKDFSDRFGTAMVKQRDNATWIVVRLGDSSDKNVSTHIENLLTVLDDNKLYVDESGARIPLQDGKVIFLAGSDLSSVENPAFISRCVVICVRSERW